MKIFGQSPAKFVHTPVKVAIVTGLSNPRCCCLDDDQRRLLQALPVPEQWKVDANFPFVDCRHDVYKSLPLWRASWSNIRQFLKMRNAAFRRLAFPHWQSLLQSTDQLLVISGSCGIELIRCLIDCQEFESLRTTTEMRLLALGPVGYGLPAASTTLVQGSRDRISRIFFRQVEITLPGIGHMDYWSSQQVQEIAQAWLTRNISKSLAPEVTCQNAD